MYISWHLNTRLECNRTTSGSMHELKTTHQFCLAGVVLETGNVTSNFLAMKVSVVIRICKM
jgi:hypothetical protein